jgi:hypothetical protein
MAKPTKHTAAKKAGSSSKKVQHRKRGKKAAACTAASKGTDDIFGFMAGKGTIIGDIVSPILTPKEWGSLYPSLRPRRRKP